MPDPKSEMLFYCYPESDPGLGGYLCHVNPLVCWPRLPGMSGVAPCSGRGLLSPGALQTPSKCPVSGNDF